MVGTDSSRSNIDDDGSSSRSTMAQSGQVRALTIGTTLAMARVVGHRIDPVHVFVLDH